MKELFFSPVFPLIALMLLFLACMYLGISIILSARKTLKKTEKKCNPTKMETDSYKESSNKIGTGW